MFLSKKSLERLDREQLIDVVVMLSVLLGDGELDDMPDFCKISVTPKESVLTVYKNGDQFIIESDDYIPNKMHLNFLLERFTVIGLAKKKDAG